MNAFAGALTEHERYYGPGEVLFSTTDAKGVIQSVNETFVRLSRYDEHELVGRPHNVIRHPDMPGAVFHLLWERIRSGLPAVAYVTNRAKDGALYRTFATIVPLGDGYMSVRTAINRLDLWAPIALAYSLTREVELGMREAGLSRSQAAARGAMDLRDRLAALGYASDVDVMRALIPAEVDERRRLAPVRLPTTTARDALHALVAPMALVDEELTALRAHFDDAAALADELSEARVGILATVDALAASSDAVAAVAASDAAPALATTARGASSLAAEVSGILAPLIDLLGEVQAAIRDLTAGLALSMLHSDMAMMFVAEAHDADMAEQAAPSIRNLARTVSGLVDADESSRARVSAYLSRAASAVEIAEAPLHDFQRILSQWRSLVLRLNVGADFAHVLAPVDRQLSRGIDEMNSLSRLGHKCRELSNPVNTERLRGAAYAVVLAADGLAG